MSSRRTLVLGLPPQVSLANLIHEGLAAGAKVEGSPADKAALATDLALEATTGHFRQRYKDMRPGRCGCGCGEKIAANKTYKLGHDKKEIGADGLIPESEAPNAGA